MSESGEPSASPTVRNHLVVDADLHTNSDYRLFTFVSQLPEEETARVPIICITEVEGQLLCAIPGTAWNRLVRLRILPPKSFLQATSVAVAAAELGARNLVSEGVFIRVWLGFLAAPFEECLEVFSEDLDRAFVTEDGDIGHLPFSDALLQVADEKFSFVSAMSGEPVEEASEVGVRVSKLEAGLQSVQATLQQLVQLQSPNPITQKTTAVLLPPKPKPAAVKDPLHGDGIAGLDASAVRAALDAGIPRAHLEQVSQLLLGRKPKFADAPGAKVEKKKPRLDVLGDTEDEAKVAEDAAPVPVPDPGVDPVGHALVKLTAIVDHLTVARKKPRSLEDTLDDSGLLQDSLSSSSSVGSSRKHAQVYQMLRKALKDSPEEIYAIIEKRMLADFGSAELAPGAPSSSSGTFRGWCEHRSRVPNIPQSVRTMWAVAGALDALRAGHIGEGKARLARPVSYRSRAGSAHGRRFPGGTSSVCFIWKAHIARLLRSSGYQTMAVCVDRKLHVESEGAGRVHRSAVQVGQGRRQPYQSSSDYHRSSKGRQDQAADWKRWWKAEQGRQGKQLQSRSRRQSPELNLSGDASSEFNPQLKNLHSRGLDNARDTGNRVPGSTASSVEPRSWWNSSFRFIRKLGTT